MRTWTPKRLADSFGVIENGHIRTALRQRYPDRPKYTRWYLGRDDIAFVGQWNVDRGNVSEKKVAETLAEFDAEQQSEALAGRGPIDAEPPEFAVIDYEGPVKREAARL